MGKTDDAMRVEASPDEPVAFEGAGVLYGETGPFSVARVWM
jgi:hypothetical protein